MFKTDAIKYTGDQEAKVITQCVLRNNVRRLKGSTISNLVLKINAKVGGVNFSADVNAPNLATVSLKNCFH